MSKYQLPRKIIALSQASNWDQAKSEWFFYRIYREEEEEPDTCLCGHFPIIEVCILKNKLNSNTAVVGNCCVKKFIGLPSDKIFQAIKRVRGDNTKSLNAEAINHAFHSGWINEWERDFYMDTLRKRKPSPKQLFKREQINDKVISGIVNARH